MIIVEKNIIVKSEKLRRVTYSDTLRLHTKSWKKKHLYIEWLFVLVCFVFEKVQQ